MRPDRYKRTSWGRKCGNCGRKPRANSCFAPRRKPFADSDLIQAGAQGRKGRKIAGLSAPGGGDEQVMCCRAGLPSKPQRKGAARESIRACCQRRSVRGIPEGIRPALAECHTLGGMPRNRPSARVARRDQHRPDNPSQLLPGPGPLRQTWYLPKVNGPARSGENAFPLTPTPMIGCMEACARGHQGFLVKKSSASGRPQEKTAKTASPA